MVDFHGKEAINSQYLPPLITLRMIKQSYEVGYISSRYIKENKKRTILSCEYIRVNHMFLKIIKVSIYKKFVVLPYDR